MTIVVTLFAAPVTGQSSDAPHGSVRLKEGQLGPLEILKAAEPPLEEAIAKYA